LKYRADIDGLRAIAVLSVVLFHLDFQRFQGGYVGVDVFFVISGYLITSIIKHKYENHEFRLAEFYARRIRRLVPPLIATIAATLLGAALIMTPYDMIAFARSAAAALFSLSNIVFYLEAGYWDTASELKPLLHTWSLGVEEQFYLFWPAFIVALLGLRRFVSFGTSLAVVSLLGAALCIWYTDIDQAAAFYLLPFRVFQFAVGALLIPVAAACQGSSGIPRRSSSAAFWSGLLAIFISVVALGENTIFPGWAVLLPTVGAALVLLSGTLPGQLDAAARALMQNPVSIWLGRVSYSMYLVHWPLIVLFRYQYGLELAFTDQLVLATGTLLATCALHYGIERRFYQRAEATADIPHVLSGGRFALRTLVVAGVLAMIAASAWKGDGWQWRFPSTTLSADQIKQGFQDRFRKAKDACQFANARSIGHCDFEAASQLLVLGDSTVVDTYNFINAGFGSDKSLNVILFPLNKCRRLREESGQFLTINKSCQQRLNMLLDPAFISRLDVVIYSVAMPYESRSANILSLLQKLKSINPKIQIVTMGGYINTKMQCSYYINKTNSTDACALPENVSYFASDPTKESLFNQFKAIESYYIDRVELLCKNRVLQTCRTRTADGVPAIYDTLHNSLEFAEMSGKLYAKKYPGLLHDRIH
jgi:peptidoglycan/LPS O-acetylase OafA/YrhL